MRHYVSSKPKRGRPRKSPSHLLAEEERRAANPNIHRVFSKGEPEMPKESPRKPRSHDGHTVVLVQIEEKEMGRERQDYCLTCKEKIYRPA